MNKFSASRSALILLLGVCAGRAGAQGSPTKQPLPTMRAGPAAWIEEYWDVKPDKVDEFIRVYKRDVYSLSRKIPGYRGYTVLTSIPGADGYPAVPGHYDDMFTSHYGIQLQGKTLTERSIDIGNLLLRTHNIIVVHNLQTWTDADAFRSNLDAAWSKNHGGEKLADHLAQTLFPLARNYWETRFRLIETGLPLEATSTPGADADGLNLEPRPSPTGWYKEYFDVPADKLDEFVRVYKANTLRVMGPIPGYRGVSLVTSLPPNAGEAARSKFKNEQLGGPDQFYVPSPGVMMDGAVRTDTSVNYSSLFKRTFTVITYYQFPANTKMLEEMQKNFEIDHPGEDRLKYITKVFFPLANNHWDMHYRAIETSFAPTSK